MDDNDLKSEVGGKYREFVRFLLTTAEGTCVFNAWCSHRAVIGQRDQIFWYSAWFAIFDRIHHELPGSIKHSLRLIVSHGHEFITAVEHTTGEMPSITWNEDEQILWESVLHFLPADELRVALNALTHPLRDKMTPVIDMKKCPLTGTTKRNILQCYLTYLAADAGGYPNKISWYKRWFFNDIFITNYQRRFPRISERYDLAVIQNHIENEMKTWGEISAESSNEYEVSTWELDGNILWYILYRLCPDLEACINVALSPIKKKTRRSIFHKA